MTLSLLLSSSRKPSRQLMIASFRKSQVSEIRYALAAADLPCFIDRTVSSLTVPRPILPVLALALASRRCLPMQGVLVSRGHFLTGPPTSLRTACLLTMALDLAFDKGAWYRSLYSRSKKGHLLFSTDDVCPNVFCRMIFSKIPGDIPASVTTMALD